MLQLHKFVGSRNVINTISQKTCLLAELYPIYLYANAGIWVFLPNILIFYNLPPQLTSLISIDNMQYMDSFFVINIY